MGHILFGLPGIHHFHLHSRVARKLAAREHRVTVLNADPVDFEFYCHQGLACLGLKPEPLPADHLVPIQEFAAVDCRLAGHRDPDRGRLKRAIARLERRVTGLLRLFETDRPDLVLLYGDRSGLTRLLDFVATQYGSAVLHAGPGLLPMTIQVDRQGIDGDATFASSTAQDYRTASIDETFIGAAAAAWLGRAFPPPLARLGVVAPPLHRRIVAAAQAAARGDWRRGLSGLNAWQQAYQIRWPTAPELELPEPPFACLLLQESRDPRLRLDAAGQVCAEQLVHSTWQALQRVDPGIGLVVAVPGERVPAAPSRGGWPAGVHFVSDTASAAAVALAAVVTTVNHPLGLAAILSGTPVLHSARAPYGIPGVALRTDGSHLAEHLAVAMSGDAGQPALRRRFLTRILKEHHVWCPPNAPDSNGVAGLVRWIESEIDCQQARERPLRYRPGPVWPLAVPDRQRKRKSSEE